MRQFDTLETARLRLRRWRESDRGPFAGLNGDPQTLVYFPATLTRGQSDAMVDRIEATFADRGFGLWAVEVRDAGQFIGFTGLSPLSPGLPGVPDGAVEIAWRLIRAAWHHGYATEAAIAARDTAFDGIELPELWSFTAVLNLPSQAVMRRIGMTESGRFDHPRVSEGSPLRPHVLFHLRNPAAPAS
jgi:RimJ/RimL family protein N-acetyltransferase